jgi:hypothetical protein
MAALQASKYYRFSDKRQEYTNKHSNTKGGAIIK